MASIPFRQPSSTFCYWHKCLQTPKLKLCGYLGGRGRYLPYSSCGSSRLVIHMCCVLPSICSDQKVAPEILALKYRLRFFLATGSKVCRVNAGLQWLCLLKESSQTFLGHMWNPCCQGISKGHSLTVVLMHRKLLPVTSRALLKKCWSYWLVAGWMHSMWTTKPISFSELVRSLGMHVDSRGRRAFMDLGKTLVGRGLLLPLRQPI